MERIRQRLLNESAVIKKSEDKRKEREGKKFGKQVQIEKQKERERSKKEMEERLKGLKRSECPGCCSVTCEPKFTSNQNARMSWTIQKRRTTHSTSQSRTPFRTILQNDQEEAVLPRYRAEDETRSSASAGRTSVQNRTPARARKHSISVIGKARAVGEEVAGGAEVGEVGSVEVVEAAVEGAEAAVRSAWARAGVFLLVASNSFNSVLVLLESFFYVPYPFTSIYT